jgi:diaminohydroxyphosphoribosylaminopyrimidine deaminase / 5-amino-6-(5-phosphoribosylamino)uracil reductase
MYVTLEPCAHEGRQPPCVEAILKAGIGRVVIASDDPSEKAAGRGPGILRDGGVEVTFATGAEATAARRLNQPFRKHARTGLPLVVLKMAMSLDGQTSTAPGDSPWISGPESRELVHRWRSESDAIAVGIGTAFTDDPLLTARIDGARQPLRVIFDSQARLPLDSQLLKTLDQAPVLVVAVPDAPQDRVSALKSAGAEVVLTNGLEPALRELGARNITSLFLEGGKTLATSFLSEDLIDESRTFIAPVLLGRQPIPSPRAGGDDAEDSLFRESPVSETGPARLPAQESSAESIGADVLITARYKEW